ncbi:PREDICTED: uncharacterized protein LOC109587459 [Amphimedon queenslandica]|uniref:EGF-like domain-containing protein n=1 Tax=Amphimedon queenslandica TaxID=400682 RepID=A0A1X7TJF1_AMPQE|nr:PREDICTED: uncharacterized protein LOC109587459 [Amphimedon queenslandica]|eukprot:XP_019859259.1 PREDICTED: uncharacterized protein LOC109587459 [Amphimedon queenslandica]
MSSYLFLLSLSLLLVCTTASTASHGEGESSSNGCTVSDTSYLISAINSTEGYNLTRAIINCLEYSDNRSTLSFGSISYETMAGTNGRYTVQCNSGLLLLSVSVFGFREERSSCYECMDAEDPCASGTNCLVQYCDHCLSASECLHCTNARYNGICLSNCPSGRIPNSMKGNECECTQNYSGENCEYCELTECENGYTFNNVTACECQKSCPPDYHKFLVDLESTVPRSVIGSPGEEEGGGHHATEGGEDSHGTSDTDTDRTFCAQGCLNDTWRVDGINGTCYACGISYCLECNTHNDCTKCRSGTLLKPTRPQYHCVGFYERIKELNETLEKDEEDERHRFEKEQLELEIVLPIVCFIVAAGFIAAAVFAHKRYPHVGKEKRHRDPTKKVVIDENTIESKFRSQSTVRFR